MKRELRMVLDKYKIYNPDNVKPNHLNSDPSEVLQKNPKFQYLSSRLFEFCNDKISDFSVSSHFSFQFKRTLFRTLGSLLNEVIMTKDLEQQQALLGRVYDWYFLKIGIPNLRSPVKPDIRTIRQKPQNSSPSFEKEEKTKDFCMLVENSKQDFSITRSKIFSRQKQIAYKGISMSSTPQPYDIGTPEIFSQKQESSGKSWGIQGKSYRKGHSFNYSFDKGIEKLQDFSKYGRNFEFKTRQRVPNSDDLTITAPIVKVYEKRSYLKNFS
jgi:hypothetical protein